MRRKLLIVLIAFAPFPAHAAEAPEQVISIGGAQTEIVYALGVENLLVGSDTTSYYPEAAEKLPKVGYNRALSAEGILSLKPDLIILSEEAGPAAVVEQVNNAGVTLLYVKSASTVDDVEDNIRIVAKALNKNNKGDELIAKMEDQEKQLKSSLPTSPTTKVLFIHQMGPTASAAGRDTAADAIIALSGGRNVVTEYEGYRPLTPEAAIALAPDVIIVAVPNLDSATDTKALLSTPGLSETPAGKNGRIMPMDALLALGFGPRTVEAAKQLQGLYQ